MSRVCGGGIVKVTHVTGSTHWPQFHLKTPNPPRQSARTVWVITPSDLPTLNPHSLELTVASLPVMECGGVYYKRCFPEGDGVGPKDVHLADCVSKPALPWGEIFSFYYYRIKSGCDFL